MPLFICEHEGCGVVENTAMGWYWESFTSKSDGVKLCSEHAPTEIGGQPTGFNGVWHNKFSRDNWKEFRKEHPNERLLNLDKFTTNKKF